ncbi:MAG: SgcJ/EcaC family oxidoreductase [Ramlibacter sp.]|nr:SgcJ/EcaC family oxidoreductase [Ramlibacter sp.]
MAIELRWVLPLVAAFACLSASAGPGDDASAVVDRWSATYSANDPDALVKLYAPDAVLLGTVSPIMSEGTAAIQAYFARLKGSGNKNAVKERRVIVLDDDAVVVTGFYDFSNAQQTPALRPSRFTMLVTRRAGEWRIQHHHSSPLVPPAN